jgi:hypothetical protein
MKYIKLFENYLSTYNNDLVSTFPGIIPTTNGIYNDTDHDDQAIEFAKNHFKLMEFKYILNREMINGILHLTLLFTKPDNHKDYKTTIKCEKMANGKNKFSFVS